MVDHTFIYNIKINIIYR